MAELIEANWVLLVIALVIGILVAWWLFVSSRRTRVEIEPADDGAEEKRVRRNQALIDAPPAAQGPGPGAAARPLEREAAPMPPAAPAGLAGAGVAVQAAAQPEPPTGSAAQPAPSEPAKPQTTDASADVPPSTADVPPATSAPPSAEREVTQAAPGDDLTRIKGLGPKIQVRLNELGVTSFAQIAAWDDAEIERIDEQLDRFRGRIRRDNWVEQARLLSLGDIAGYEDRFGKL